MIPGARKLRQVIMIYALRKTPKSQRAAERSFLHIEIFFLILPEIK